MVRGGILILTDFTIPQLAYYRALCNFMPDELQLFDCRAKGHSLDECCDILGYDDISKVKNLSRKVNKKMIEVTNVVDMRKWIRENYG